MIYDNWHTATCMKYCFSGSPNNSAQIAQKVSFAFKAMLTPLKYWGVFPQWMSPLWYHQGLPLMWQGCFPLYLGISPFYLIISNDSYLKQSTIVPFTL